MSNYILQTWRRYRAEPGMAREVFMLVIALVAGGILAPLCIWLGGSLVLGPYFRDPSGQRSGGASALYADFFQGLANGAPGYWIVLLGPYVMYMVLRILRRSLRT